MQFTNVLKNITFFLVVQGGKNKNPAKFIKSLEPHIKEGEENENTSTNSENKSLSQIIIHSSMSMSRLGKL